MRHVLLFCILAVSGLAAYAQSGEVKKFANESEVPRITIAEAKKGFDDDSVIFVDSRSAEAFNAERIKGAIRIEGAADDRFDSLPKGKKIIVYCT